MASIDLAILGAGAVTERLHLPALATLGLTPRVLVDRNLARARDLAARYRITHVVDDYRACSDRIQAAIVALPHHLHAPVSIDLLRRGTHVLVEKPMALSVREADEMIAAADERNAVLAVGLFRRFQWVANYAKAVLDAGLLGELTSFEIREGLIYSWPVASGFFFRRETAGGGVLVDTGAHTLDLLLWWLGDVASVAYYDDSYGGVEADCRLDLSMASGVSGTIELSRTRNLCNAALLRGERATLAVHIYENRATIQLTGSPLVAGGPVRPDNNEAAEQSSVDLGAAQLADWYDAIATGRPPRVSGVVARRSLKLIERCYALRQPLPQPWMMPDLQARA